MAGIELNSRLGEIDHSKIKSPHSKFVGIFKLHSRKGGYYYETS